MGRDVGLAGIGSDPRGCAPVPERDTRLAAAGPDPVEEQLRPRPREKLHMLIVHATLVVQPDKRDEFVAAFAGLAETTNQEDGVLSYTLYESAATPSSFMVVEEYKDEDAFNAHMTSEHFQA